MREIPDMAIDIASRPRGSGTDQAGGEPLGDPPAAAGGPVSSPPPTTGALATKKLNVYYGLFPAVRGDENAR